MESSKLELLVAAVIGAVIYSILFCNCGNAVASTESFGNDIPSRNASRQPNGYSKIRGPTDLNIRPLMRQYWSDLAWSFILYQSTMSCGAHNADIQTKQLRARMSDLATNIAVLTGAPHENPQQNQITDIRKLTRIMNALVNDMQMLVKQTVAETKDLQYSSKGLYAGVKELGMALHGINPRNWRASDTDYMLNNFVNIHHDLLQARLRQDWMGEQKMQANFLDAAEKIADRLAVGIWYLRKGL